MSFQDFKKKQHPGMEGHQSAILSKQKHDQRQERQTSQSHGIATSQTKTNKRRPRTNHRTDRQPPPVTPPLVDKRQTSSSKRAPSYRNEDNSNVNRSMNYSKSRQLSKDRDQDQYHDHDVAEICPRKSSSQKAQNNNNNNNNSNKGNHSVRPRLSTRCPVTQKRLLNDNDDDAMSRARSVCHSQYESDEETEMLPPMNVREAKATTNQSVFAHLNESIVHFQKMVAQLEDLFREAASSPEAQWKARILQQSAQDADRDISSRLQTLATEQKQYTQKHHHHHHQQRQRQQHAKSEVALRKLYRDYKRVHDSLDDTIKAQQRQQQAEVSMLHKGTTQQEDFFDRAMRERDEELNQIHKSMHHVNNIYQDLAAMVDEQQENIDRIAERTEESKATTQSGLKQVQATVFGMCAGEGQIDEQVQEEHIQKQIQQKNEQQLHQDGNDEGFLPSCQVRLRLLEKMKDVNAIPSDVWKFGQELWDDLQENIVEGRLSGCSDTVGSMECLPVSTANEGKQEFRQGVRAPHCEKPNNPKNANKSLGIQKMQKAQTLQMKKGRHRNGNGIGIGMEKNTHSSNLRSNRRQSSAFEYDDDIPTINFKKRMNHQ